MFFALCSVSLAMLLPTIHAVSIEALNPAINWEYGGWRPILPGSPFFFVKTHRASAARDVSLEGQASSISTVKVPPPSRSGAESKSDDLKAEASTDQETSSDTRASSSRQIPVGLPPVGGIPGCCDFQPVLYIKQQPGVVLGHQASHTEAQYAKPRPPEYQAHEPVPASEASGPDLDHGGSQIIHGTPIGNERPQLPHQLFHGGHGHVNDQAQTAGGLHHEITISPEQASALAHSVGAGHSILNVLNRLPSLPPAADGNVMSLLSGLQGHALPPHIQSMIHHVHSTGNIPSNIPPELAHMIGSLMRGGSHHQGGGDKEGPQQPHPTAPPFHPRPDKNIFTWYPRPQTTPATPHKPVYSDGFPKPHKHLHGGQLIHHSHHHDGIGGPAVPVAVVHGPVIEGETVQLPPPGPIQPVHDAGHGHHVHQEVLEAEIIHSDSQQNVVTAQPHLEAHGDQQAEHSQQRPPFFRPQQTPHQGVHHPDQGGHRVRFPQIQEHRIDAEVVHGRPETDYDPSQPPRIHVEEVPPDVLATGIHPSGHPIRVDGINLNIIAPSPVTSHGTHPGTETQQQAPQDDRYDHYHRPEDVPGSSQEEHGDGYQSESQRESSVQHTQHHGYNTYDHGEQGHGHQGHEEQSHVEPGPAYPGQVEQGHMEQAHAHRGHEEQSGIGPAPAYPGQVEQGHMEQGHAHRGHEEQSGMGPAYPGHVEQGHEHSSGHVEQGHLEQGHEQSSVHEEQSHAEPRPAYPGHVERGHVEQDNVHRDYLHLNHVQHNHQGQQDHGLTQQGDYQDGDYIGETPERSQEHATVPPPSGDAGSHQEKGQRGAIHFHPIPTEKVEEDEPPPQLYHAYYAPAQHKPPPGYVRMTVEEFNKIFKDAEIQFIGSETDLSKKLENQTKLQVADSDSQESSVKIETVPTSEEKTSVRTSVSMSTSSSSDGSVYPGIQPRHASKDTSVVDDISRTPASTEKPSKVFKKPEGGKDKVKSVPNLFGARLKTPRKLRTTTQATNE